MNKGWKLGLGLGVLVIAIAVAVVALMDHGQDAARAPQAASTSGSHTTFGGLDYAQVGGIAGMDFHVRIDSDFHMRTTNHGASTSSTLPPAKQRALLRLLAAQATPEHRADASPNEGQPYPDQLSQGTQFNWKGKPYVIDGSPSDLTAIIGDATSTAPR